MDTSSVDKIDDDALEKFLHDMLSLYLRVWSYSLGRDIVSKHKTFFEEKMFKGSPKRN